MLRLDGRLRTMMRLMGSDMAKESRVQPQRLSYVAQQTRLFLVVQIESAAMAVKRSVPRLWPISRAALVAIE